VHQVHGGSGDPSPFTAYGTLQGLMATLNAKFGNEEVGKYSYAVQGVGHVGGEFVKLLRERGAKVFVTDINKDAVQRCVDDLGCEAVGLDEIYDVDADVYSPCALGGTVNHSTMPAFQVQGHLRRREQPAGHRRLRRRSRTPRHHLRARLRGERRRADERIARNRRLQPRARHAHDAHDLPQPRQDLRAIAKRDNIPSYKAATAWPKSASTPSARSSCRTWATAPRASSAACAAWGLPDTAQTRHALPIPGRCAAPPLLKGGWLFSAFEE
jgi:hypothetical protein